MVGSAERSGLGEGRDATAATTATAHTAVKAARSQGCGSINQRTNDGATSFSDPKVWPEPVAGSAWPQPVSVPYII